MAKFFADGCDDINDILESEFADEGLNFNFAHKEMECSKS